MHSLRIYNPEAYVTVVSDKDTFNGLTGNRAKIKEYVDEFITQELPEGLSMIQKSRFMKTSLRPTINGDFLYIDTDTVISDKISDIGFEGDMGAVLSLHKSDWDNYEIPTMLKTYISIKKESSELKVIKNFHNTGVIYSKDTEVSLNFFLNWHRLWWNDSINYDYHKDQPAFWQTNAKFNNLIISMDGVFNCQIHFPAYSFRYVQNAKILHYFSTSIRTDQFFLKQSHFLQKIREKGINQEVESTIIGIKSIILDYIKAYILDIEKKLREKLPIIMIERRIAKKFPFIRKISGLLMNKFLE